MESYLPLIDGRRRTGAGRGNAGDPGFPVPEGFEVASIWRRLAAYLIDLFVLLVVGIVVGSIVIGLGMKHSVTQNAFGSPAQAVSTTLSPEGVVVAGLIDTLIRGFYFVTTWMVLRASPAQKLLGLQVGSYADGTTLTLAQAVIRWLALGVPLDLLSILSPNEETANLAGILGFIWIAVLLITTYVTPFQQGLHDRFAGSLVLRELPQEPEPIKPD